MEVFSDPDVFVETRFRPVLPQVSVSSGCPQAFCFREKQADREAAHPAQDVKPTLKFEPEPTICQEMPPARPSRPSPRSSTTGKPSNPEAQPKCPKQPSTVFPIRPRHRQNSKPPFPSPPQLRPVSELVAGMNPPPKTSTRSPPTHRADGCPAEVGLGHEKGDPAPRSPILQKLFNVFAPSSSTRMLHEFSKEGGIKEDNDDEEMRESLKEGGIRDENDETCRISENRDVGPWSSPIIKSLVGIFSPFSPGSGSRRPQNVFNGSFMVGTMPVEFSEVLDATSDTAQEVALNKICSDPELLREFELTMFPAKEGSIFSSGVSFLKDLLSQKTLPVEDMSSFSGDSDYPSNTAKLDKSFEEFSAMVRYELALARIQAGIVLSKDGYRNMMGPSRLLLRRLFYRQKVERDVLELRKRFGDMEKLFQRLEGSTVKGFEELRQCFKQLTLENKKIIDDGLAAIEKASNKDRAAVDAAFDELKTKLGSFEEQFAPFVKDLEKASKNGSLFERLKVEMILRNASYVSGILYHIVCFIRDGKPDPTPTPPVPAPPSPSPVQEEEEVVKPPPSKPTTHYFYKSIGRQNKGLLHQEFALTPSVSSKFKVPVGPDDRSNLSVLVCTGDKVACKVSCDGLFEDNVRMTFTAGLHGFKPKAKLFYAFPFAGVNGHLNASVVCGAAPDLKLALTLEKLGIVAGGKVLFDPLTKGMKHHQFGVSYGPGALKLVDGDTLKLSLYEGGLSHGVSGGLELTYSHAKEEAVVCGAVKVKVSDGTAVKAKVDSTGVVTAAVQHHLLDGLDVGACARVSRGEPACYGFSVKSRE